MAEGINRISSPADPDRCQGITAMGQCQNKVSVPGGKYCSMHGGAIELRAQEKANLNRYRLSKFQSQYEKHLSQPEVKSLRDEIAILRMMLEERLNSCTGSSDLVIASGPISDLIGKIEKVVVSCHKLELAADQMLDKARLFQIADQVVKAVGKYIPPDVLSSASVEILAAFSEQPAPVAPAVKPLPSGTLDISDDDDDQT